MRSLSLSLASDRDNGCLETLKGGNISKSTGACPFHSSAMHYINNINDDDDGVSPDLFLSFWRATATTAVWTRRRRRIEGNVSKNPPRIRRLRRRKCRGARCPPSLGVFGSRGIPGNMLNRCCVFPIIIIKKFYTVIIIIIIMVHYIAQYFFTAQ